MTQYVTVDGVLYVESTGSNTLVYYYDDAGTPYAFTHNNVKYYYEYNVMGDVIGLFDSTGTRVVQYTYTPYGALASMTDSTATGVGTLNPIRYRGYYYDAETGLYYCNTRYYDPEIGRWINADGQLNTDAILGYNMFAYSYNNPIMLKDSTGNRPIASMDVRSETKNDRMISCTYMKANATAQTNPNPPIEPIKTSQDIVVSPTKTADEKQDFVDTMYSIGKSHESDTGIPAALFAAQSAYESGYGTSSLAINKNNLFGFVGYEFDSFEQCIASYENTLTQNPKYKHLFGMNLYDWVHGIGPAGYCPEEDYGDKLWAVVVYWDLHTRG